MNLTADWVVGFVDGEGCFYVGINRHSEMTAGWQVLPEFRIVQHKREIKLLYALKKFFRSGVVRENHGDRYELRIRKLNCLKNVVSFFRKHPLKTLKNVDFKKFAYVINLMEKGSHLTNDGLLTIIKTAKSMNTQNQPKLNEIEKEIKNWKKIESAL